MCLHYSGCNLNLYQTLIWAGGSRGPAPQLMQFKSRPGALPDLNVYWREHRAGGLHHSVCSVNLKKGAAILPNGLEGAGGLYHSVCSLNLNQDRYHTSTWAGGSRVQAPQCMKPKSKPGSLPYFHMAGGSRVQAPQCMRLKSKPGALSYIHMGWRE